MNLFLMQKSPHPFRVWGFCWGWIKKNFSISFFLERILSMIGKSNPFRVGDKHPLEYIHHSIEYTSYSGFAFSYFLPQKFQWCLAPSSMLLRGSTCFWLARMQGLLRFLFSVLRASWFFGFWLDQGRSLITRSILKNISENFKKKLFNWKKKYGGTPIGFFIRYVFEG